MRLLHGLAIASAMLISLPAFAPPAEAGDKHRHGQDTKGQPRSPPHPGHLTRQAGRHGAVPSPYALSVRPPRRPGH